MVPPLPPPPRRATPAAVAAARLFIVPSRTVDDVEIAVALGGLDLTNAGVLARHRGAYGFLLEEGCCDAPRLEHAYASSTLLLRQLDAGTLAPSALCPDCDDRALVRFLLVDHLRALALLRAASTTAAPPPPAYPLALLTLAPPAPPAPPAP